MQMTEWLTKARELVWMDGDHDKDHSNGLVVFGSLEVVLGILVFSVGTLLLVLLSYGFKKAKDITWWAGNPDKDYSAGLVAFGTVKIVLGILCLSIALLLLGLMSYAGLGDMHPAHFWMVEGMLFSLSGWFVVMGLGSIRVRRWARVLVLAGSWVTIFFGTLAMALMLYILPGSYDLLADSGLLSPADALTALAVAMLLLFVLQLVVPMADIAFYSLKGVQHTCERRNPAACWTDQCPLPLLAMGCISALGCLSVIFGAATNYVVFVFGHVLSGWQGFVPVLLMSVLCGYVGWGAFTRKMHAWWTAYALIVLSSASMMLSFSELDMNTLYGIMGYSRDQILQMGQLQRLSPAVLTIIACVWGVMASIYLVWVRDCFLPEQGTEEVKSYRQRMAEEAAACPASPEPVRLRMRLED